MPVPTERADLVLQLFDAYYERVYAFLRKSTAPEIAEDLAQEVFVRLLQHPQLEELTISVSYLIKIAHNLLRRRYARAARLRELLAERQAPGEVHEGSTPLMVDAAVLETALGLLSSDEQNAVRLIVCEGKSYQHAAESLGVTVTMVNNWKHRGLQKMRKMLADAENPNAHARRSSATIPGRHEHHGGTSERHAGHGDGRHGGRGDERRPERPRWNRTHGWAIASDEVA